MDSQEACQRMELLDFDVMGINEKGSIIGYVNKVDLKSGTCSDHIKQFKVTELISESTPIIDFISLFKERKRLFVLDKNQVKGIITRGDLQKTSLRMLLFGYISLLEMQMQRIIQNMYPNDTWKTCLKTNRIKKAEELLMKRKKRNEDIGLLDCTQICDKSTILSKIDNIKILLNENHIVNYSNYLSKIKSIRDNIAHSQDLIEGTNWDSFFDVIEKLEMIINICEKFPETIDNKKVG